jgi:crotonobetainyl-CoA:carnitine CoA-transferase CaiB-like acyl-CoA transferase
MSSARPLSGIKVLDFTHVLSGPYTTMLLSDAGAEVVKVEPPNGEIARTRGLIRTEAPGGTGRTISAYYAAVNIGKRGIVLDLKNERGVALANQLAHEADVIVENFSAGVLARLGVDMEALRKANPRLITASIHFDRIDPNDVGEPRRGLAVVAEAESGLLRAGKWSAGDARPRDLGFVLGDFVTGMTAYAAIVTSLVGRFVTGEGAHHEIGMLESLIPMNSLDVVNLQFSDRGIPFKNTAGYGLFRTIDSWVTIGINSNVLWGRLTTVMGRSDLATDERYANYVGRDLHADALNEMVNDWSSTRESKDLLAALSAAGVPCGKVNTALDLLRDDLESPRGLFEEAGDGLGGQVRLPANGMGFQRGMQEYPLLGGDTYDVLRTWLNLEGPEIDNAAAVGAFGPAGTVS